MSLLGIIKSGDIVGAVKKIWSLIFGTDMPQPLANLVAKFATDDGKIVWEAGTTAAKDIASGKTFAQAVADGWQIIATQVPTATVTDLEDAVGIQVRAAASVQTAIPQAST